MKKYIKLAQISIQELFVYRLNFLLWRFRNIISLITLIFFWSAIFQDKSTLLGYSREQILAYIIGISLLKSLILGTRVGDLAGQIKTGELTKIISKPMGMYKFWLTKDLVDKVLNLFFTIFEIYIVTQVFGIDIYIPRQLSTIFLFSGLIILAVMLNFFINFVLSITSFWTEEIWATRWLFIVIFLEFFAGVYFPVDILPSWLTKIILLTPFPYLAYYPIKIWLGQLGNQQTVQVFVVCAAYLLFFYLLAKYLYRKGIRNYQVYGG